MPAADPLLVGTTLARKNPGHPVWQLRPEDLLQREIFSVTTDAARALIAGRTALVTGAAGSIGSQLCREIAALRPWMLVAVDRAETPLFLLERELKQAFPSLELRVELSDLNGENEAERLVRAYKPDTIFHAAAFKHVAMMERNIAAAVANNVVVTARMAVAAFEGSVAQFALISTDKAVRPVSVMGATKRMAEMVIESMPRSMPREKGTRFAAVRFGNVLGSSGSVMPIFQEQIAAGGPVTITHPDMERWFMTAGEAAQLVLESAAIAEGGEVFTLDMGEPTRIADLARRMIELAGLRTDSGLWPGQDIAIEFTEPTQGERISEDVAENVDGEHTVTRATGHARIRALVSQTPQPTAVEIAAMIGKLERAAESRDDAALLGILQQAVPDFRPAPSLLGTSGTSSGK